MDGQLLARQLSTELMDDPRRRLAGLFDTHYDRLYRLARRLVSEKDEAGDLVQETFLRAARAPESVPFGIASHEEAWLVRVLINVRRDEWRKKEVRSRHNILSTSHERNPESALLAKATVWQALDRLAPRRRAVIVMHELEGMPADAIAELLGIRTITVRWHLSAGRRELTRILRPYLGDSHENNS